MKAKCVFYGFKVSKAWVVIFKFFGIVLCEHTTLGIKDFFVSSLYAVNLTVLVIIIVFIQIHIKSRFF